MSARWDSVPHPTVTRVYLQGVGHVRVHQHRPVQGRVKTITARREGGRWYVIMSCDDVPAEPLDPAGAPVGIDMGVASFLATSDGVHVPSPRHLPQPLASSRRPSGTWPAGGAAAADGRRRPRRVARLHGKVRRQRLDHAHKTALALVRHHDLIVHEDLQVANLTRQPRPRPDGTGGHEPKGASAKSGLNKSILDAGWGIFLRVPDASRAATRPTRT